MATTPDGSLNAVDGIVEGLADVRIKELNDRYLAGGIGLVSRLLQSEETVSKLVVFLKPDAGERRLPPHSRRRFRRWLSGRRAARQDLAVFSPGQAPLHPSSASWARCWW
jgi:hypothetical protein